MTLSLILCSSGSNAQGEFEGFQRAPCQLKKPLEGLRQGSCWEERKIIIEESVIFYQLAPLIFDYFCPHCPALSVSKRREFLPVLLSSSCHSVPCHKWGTKLKQKPHVTSKVHFQGEMAGGTLKIGILSCSTCGIPILPCLKFLKGKLSSFFNNVCFFFQPFVNIPLSW